jgi:hypothetical protein
MAKPRPNLRRYHNKIYFPENLGAMCAEFIGQINDVDITYHAAEQLIEDRRGIIPLPSREEIFHPSNTLVEIYEQINEFGVSLNKIQKMLIRVHNLNEQYDYSYVLAREGFIVSAWANDKNDEHRLDSKASKDYYRPSEAPAEAL